MTTWNTPTPNADNSTPTPSWNQNPQDAPATSQDSNQNSNTPTTNPDTSNASSNDSAEVQQKTIAQLTDALDKEKKKNKNLQTEVKELHAKVEQLAQQQKAQLTWTTSAKPQENGWDGDIKVRSLDNSTNAVKPWTEEKKDESLTTESSTPSENKQTDAEAKSASIKPQEAKPEQKSSPSSANEQKEKKVWFFRRIGRGIKKGFAKLWSWIATWAKTVGNIVGYVPDKLSHWINFWTNAMSHPNGIFEKIGAVCSRPLRKGIELANLWLAGATKLFKRDSQELKTAWYQFRWKEGKIIKMDTATQTKKAA